MITVRHLSGARDTSDQNVIVNTGTGAGHQLCGYVCSCVGATKCFEVFVLTKSFDFTYERQVVVRMPIERHGFF